MERRMIDDPLWGKIEYINVEAFEELLKEILKTNVIVCCKKYKYWHFISQWCDVKGCEKKRERRLCILGKERRMNHIKNCDNCIHYHWYYDWCDKYDVEVKGEAVYDCFEREE